MTAQLDRIAQKGAAPGRVGQATAVEQSRAVAEVQAQVIVAQQFPRDPPAATAAMREACAQQQLADRAFFSFPRGKDERGKPVIISGPSVHLARELARCWGNIQYGVSELRRDDTAAQSEMLAFAWDVQINTRSSSVFIVPHMRDRRGGPEQLTDMRDIYENNANNGARRVREAIFGVLPVWFTEEAKTLCAKTLSDGGGRPLAQRIADAVEAFANMGVKVGQLEERTGSKKSAWTAQDVATLHVLITSIRRGEIRKEDAFPQDRLTAEDITRPQPRVPENPTGAPPAGATEPTAAPASGKTAPPGKPSKAATEKLTRLLAQLPVGDDADRMVLIEWITGQPVSAALNRGDVDRVTTFLEDALQNAEGDTELAASRIWEQHRQSQGEDNAG